MLSGLQIPPVSAMLSATKPARERELLRRTNHSYVVGIAGGTCSGKSTLCTLLSQRLEDLQPTVICMDRYFMQPAPNTVAPITRKVYVEHNHPTSLRLDDLYADLDAAIEKGGLILVEGLFALHLDPVREKLNLKVFVDLKSDERLYRRIKRWIDRQSMDEIAERYLDTVRFRHDELVEPSRWHADVVLNGTLDRGQGVDILETYIRARA